MQRRLVGCVLKARQREETEKEGIREWGDVKQRVSESGWDGMWNDIGMQDKQQQGIT